MAEPSLINSILRGAEALKCLGDGVDRLKEVAERLDLTKSSAHRLLKSLEASGLVMQDPVTRRYYLGPLILSLASNPMKSYNSLVICSLAEMKYLGSISEETVVLHVMMGLQRICLEEVPSIHNIKYSAGVGAIAPVYVGSAGKMLLSELEEDELGVLLNNIRFEPVGPNTITDREELLKELAKARELQYATSFGERVRGSASISVPIKNFARPACLSVLGPEDRFKVRMMDVLKTMRESSARIAVRLSEL